MLRIGAASDSLGAPRIQVGPGDSARAQGRRIGDSVQEPIDAEFRILDEAPRRAQRKRVGETRSRGSAQSLHSFLRARNMSHGWSAFYAYLPSQDYVGTLIDALA